MYFWPILKYHLLFTIILNLLLFPRNTPLDFCQFSVKFSASLHRSTQHTFDMYVIHRRLAKVAKLASLVITVFNWEKAGQWRHSRMRTIGECQKIVHVPLSLKNVFHERHPQWRGRMKKKIKCNFSLYPAYERERVRVSFIEYKYNK